MSSLSKLLDSPPQEWTYWDFSISLSNITSYYSVPGLAELLKASNRVYWGQSRKSSAMTSLKRKSV